jgi:hypothetical protein
MSKDKAADKKKIDTYYHWCGGMKKDSEGRWVLKNDHEQALTEVRSQVIRDVVGILEAWIPLNSIAPKEKIIKAVKSLEES